VSVLQKIVYNGRLAAVVLADQAILTDRLPDHDERTVKAMCLYAMESAAGLYSDERALEYARRAAAEAPQ
jgi:hypothetical protein